jgi:hypothetical protein
MGSFVPFIPSLAEGSAVEVVEGSTARATSEASPQPPGSGLRACRTGLTDPWREPSRTVEAQAALVLTGSLAEGLAPLAPNGIEGSAAHVTFELSPQPAGSRLRKYSTDEGLVPLSPSVLLEPTRTSLSGAPRATKVRAMEVSEGAFSNRNTRRLVWREPASPIFGGPGRPLSGGRDAFRRNKNRPPRAPKAICFGALRTGDNTLSNRNTNERRNTATFSESTTSKFLIATKLHFSEEKAKSEEKTKSLRGVEHNCSGDGRMLMVARAAERGPNPERIPLC